MHDTLIFFALLGFVIALSV